MPDDCRGDPSISADDFEGVLKQRTRHGTLHCPSQPKFACHRTHKAHLALGQPLLDALCVEDVIAWQQTNLIGWL